jgi:hypothetical protein
MAVPVRELVSVSGPPRRSRTATVDLIAPAEGAAEPAPPATRTGSSYLFRFPSARRLVLMATWYARFQRLVRARGSLIRDAVAAASIVRCLGGLAVLGDRSPTSGSSRGRSAPRRRSKRSSAPTAESQAVQSLERGDGCRRDERLDPAASSFLDNNRHGRI